MKSNLARGTFVKRLIHATRHRLAISMVSKFLTERPVAFGRTSSPTMVALRLK
jgi:hypothetical protein